MASLSVANGLHCLMECYGFSEEFKALGHLIGFKSVDAIQPATEPAVSEPSTSNTERVSEIPITVPCSINLSDISVKLKDGRLILPKPIVPLEPHITSDRTQYDLR